MIKIFSYNFRFTFFWLSQKNSYTGCTSLIFYTMKLTLSWSPIEIENILSRISFGNKDPTIEPILIQDLEEIVPDVKQEIVTKTIELPPIFETKIERITSIPKPIEVIKEVHVVDEKLLNEKNQEIEDLKNKVDYEKRQSSLLQNKFESTEKELNNLNQKIQGFDSQIKELNRLKAKETDFNKIQDALSQINDLEKKKNILLNDSENLGKILKAFGDGKDFFNKNILYIGTLSINESTKKALEKEVTEFLNIVDNWKFAITQRFLESNNLLSVGG